MAKKKRIRVALTLPIPVLAYFEGVAEYSGVKLEDVINVVLVMEMLRKGDLTQGKEGGQ